MSCWTYSILIFHVYAPYFIIPYAPERAVLAGWPLWTASMESSVPWLLAEISQWEGSIIIIELNNMLFCWIFPKKLSLLICHGMATFLSRHFVISSVQSLSSVWLFATPWIAARQASLSITNSRSSLKLMSIESVMPSSHLILCRPLLLLSPTPPSIRVFSNESTLCMRWPKY